MDGVLDLEARHGCGAQDVASVDLHMPRVHFNNVFYTDPTTPLEAKFSAEYAVGCVLARGDCTLADFTPERVAGADVRSLFPLIHRHPVDKLEANSPPKFMSRSTTGGSSSPGSSGRRAARAHRFTTRKMEPR